MCTFVEDVSTLLSVFVCLLFFAKVVCARVCISLLGCVKKKANRLYGIKRESLWRTKTAVWMLLVWMWSAQANQSKCNPGSQTSVHLAFQHFLSFYPKCDPLFGKLVQLGLSLDPPFWRWPPEISIYLLILKFKSFERQKTQFLPFNFKLDTI